jgi:drug/metabolite transporter (DMT)-like permease
VPIALRIRSASQPTGKPAPADRGAGPEGRGRLRLTTPPVPPKASPLVAAVAWLSLCGIWGSTWLAIKVGLRDLPPITFAGVRFVIAAAVLFGVIAIRRIRLPWAGRDWRLLIYTGFLTITVNYAFVFWGEQYISSGLAALLNATIPLFGLPLAHRYLASEPLTTRKIAGVLLGLVGVLVVFGAELTGGPLAFWAGAGIVVASLSGAQGSVLMKARGSHLDPAVTAGVQMAAGCVPLLVVGIALEGNPLAFHWTAVSVAALGYLALVGSVVAFLAYYWLIRQIEVTRVLLIPLVTPLVAVLLGTVFLGEELGWGTVLGGGAIIAGVMMTIIQARAR